MQICYLNKEILSEHKPSQLFNDRLNILKDKISKFENSKADENPELIESNESELTNLKKEYEYLIEYKGKLFN